MRYGDLVVIHGGERGIGRILDGGKHYTWVQHVGAEMTLRHLNGDLTLVTSDPPFAAGDPPLQERGKRLRKIVERAWRNAKRDEDGQLLCQLDALLRRQAWFWRAVAVSLDNPRHWSYASKPEYVDNDRHRRFCSVSKFLKNQGRKYGASFSDAECDRLGELLAQSCPDSFKLEFAEVTGDAIYDAYDEEDFGSCMAGESYIRWYGDNPKTVSLLTVREGGDLVGRALLWNTDQGGRYLDRIYPSDGGPQVAAMEEYAASQGWDYRLNHTCDYPRTASGKTGYRVTMAPSRHDYPYLDSFKGTDQDPEGDEDLILYFGGGTFTFCETDGGYQGDRGEECCECGERTSEDDAHVSEDGDIYCSDCYHDRYTYLDYSHDGRRIEGEYSNDEVSCCDDCGNERLTEHLAEAEGNDVCSRCLERHYSICDQCDEYTKEGETLDDRTLCLECYNDLTAACKECEEVVAREDLVQGTHCENCAVDCPECGQLKPPEGPCEACRRVPPGQLALPELVAA